MLAYNLVLDEGLGSVRTDVFLFLVLEYSHTVAFLPISSVGGDEGNPKPKFTADSRGQGSRPQFYPTFIGPFRFHSREEVVSDAGEGMAAALTYLWKRYLR